MRRKAWNTVACHVYVSFDVQALLDDSFSEHISHSMPWSPTRDFPHPIANIKSSNANSSMTNEMSYTLVEMMTWEGLGGTINKFRNETLDLDTLSLAAATTMFERLRIPYTYCW